MNHILGINENVSNKGFYPGHVVEAPSEPGHTGAEWQREVKEAIRTFEMLEPYLSAFRLGEHEIGEIKEAIRQKGIKVPRRYLEDLIASIQNDLERTQIGNFILPRLDKPIADRTRDTTTFLDKWSVDNNPRKGLTRMYQDRVLMSPTHDCMVHCTWCFRDMGVGLLTVKELESIFEYIRKDGRITDVIITGGEPLLISDRRIDYILRSLRAIDHVDIIRFHTRIPVVLPSRIDESFVRIVNQYKGKGKPIYVVTQYIHPNELTERSTDAVYRLVENGIYVFNQAPVLRGVNDDQETFNRLLKKMIKYQIKPYYAITTIIKDGQNSRFYVPFEEVQSLVNEYSSRFDGLGRPTVIIPVMGKKMSPSQLKQEMGETGAYVRNTKSEIWKGTK